MDNGAAVTNEGYEYDPASDSWSDLPAANNAEYRGGGSCGMYKIGGSTGGFSPTPFSEVLPGYDQCGASADVPWLSEDPASFDVAPGADRHGDRRDGLLAGRPARHVRRQAGGRRPTRRTDHAGRGGR